MRERQKAVLQNREFLGVLYVLYVLCKEGEGNDTLANRAPVHHTARDVSHHEIGKGLGAAAGAVGEHIGTHSTLSQHRYDSGFYFGYVVLVCHLILLKNEWKFCFICAME